MDLHASSFVFSMPMWLMCSWSNTCGSSSSGMTMYLHFIMTPSITAMWSLNDQYTLMSWWRCSLLPGQPAMIYPFSHCRCPSCVVACCICWTDMHLGHLLTSVLHPPFCPCHILLHLCLPCDSDGTANLQWKFLVLACILFWPCIDVSWGGCTWSAVTKLLCLS